MKSNTADPSEGVPKIVVHVGDGWKDNAPARHELTLEALVKRLTGRPRVGEKDGKFIQFVDYAEGAHRDKAHVSHVYAYVADIDRGDLSEQDIRDAFGGIQCVAYSTWSSGPLATEEEAAACAEGGEEAAGGDHCRSDGYRCKAHNGRTWRVVAPYRALASVAIAEAVHDYHFAPLLGDDLGAESRKVAQVWYLPACPVGRQEHHVGFEIEGELFDPLDYAEVAEHGVADEAPPRECDHAVIKAWNEAHPLPAVLAAHGYTLIHKGAKADQYRHPASTSGTAGAWLYHDDGKIVAHSGNDPLGGENATGKQIKRDSFDVMRILDQGGDWAEAFQYAEMVLGRAAASEEPPEGETLEQAIDRLAALDPLSYERVRKAEAKRFEIRTSILDAAVRDARGDEGATGAGQGIEFEEVEPWDQKVDGAEVLAEIALAFERYLALPEHAAKVQTLWVTHCHVFQAFQHSPRLNITAPERGCGKTVNLDVIAALVPRACPTENVSTPAFFRLAERDGPTFLMDEYDTYLAADKTGDLRGALNAGHRYGGQVIRCVGDDSEPRGFKVFAPVALGGIRELPGTLHDRSIVIRMKRATKAEIEKLERFNRRHKVEHDLARKLARWTADNRAKLEKADPDMGELYNRAADNWRPLYAIADLAGALWPEWVRAAAAVHAEQDRGEEIRVELLRDILSVFSRGVDRLHTATLVERLRGLEDRPWEEFGKRGKGLTGSMLALMLKPFGVKSRQVRIANTNRHGYHRADFADAFERYLDDSETPEDQDFGDF